MVYRYDGIYRCSDSGEREREIDKMRARSTVSEFD